MEGHSQVLANRLHGLRLSLLHEESRVVVFEQMDQIRGVEREDVDAVDQRLRAEVRFVGVRPLVEDTPGAVGRAVYSVTR